MHDPWALNLRRLRAFVAAVRHGGAAAAARAVHVSQPAVTQGIAALEAAIGADLFVRRPDGLTPTEAALVFLPRVEEALAAIRSPRITGTQARAFLALARAGAYAAAGTAAGVTAPSLHRAVADLEFAVGGKLVNRRGRGHELTARGRQLTRALSLAAVALQAGLEEVAALSGPAAGRIAIGAMPLCRARLLPDAVVAFQQQWPDARIAIAEGAHRELIEPLRDGDLDLLIGALRTPSPGPDIEQAPLFEDHPCVIARANHPLAARRRRPTLSDLRRYPWIVPAPGAPLREQWRRLFQDGGLDLPDAPIECGSVITIRQILLKSECLTILSREQVRLELDAGLLGVVADTPPHLKRTIGVTTRTGWRPTPMQADFLRLLHDLAQTS
ncbi:MAG: LysR family transcriptional regulator [Hyphomonadaceae bacterium]|nr:LysR family transcriptional regulator [Hyphomonadaceae bacterium]